ncbi:MAG: hypothetical protein HKN16_05175, partial [Saprospiraceae bacterium]|nr:hypothetical protein [Saprospiraceae bacterium]
TWTAVDECGNEITCDQSITIIDEEAPVITCPVNLTVSCDDSLDPEDLGGGVTTATDNCDPTPLITFEDVFTQGVCPQESVLTRTWTATDACGNSSSCDQIISIQDNLAPSFSFFPEDAEIECFEDPTPIAGTDFEVPTIVDNCDPAPMLTYTDVSIGNPPCYTIQRTWIATDACSNTISRVQSITFIDGIAPTFGVELDDLTLNCEEGLPASIDVLASDNCELPVDVEVNDVTIETICANTFTVERTYTATDACGNMNSISHEILIQDLEMPEVTFDPPTTMDLTIECSDPTPIVPGLTLSDNCTPVDQLSVTFNEIEITPENDQDFNLLIECPTLSIIRRTWVVTDECSNFREVSQEIVIQDTQAPTFDPFTETYEVECGTDITPGQDFPAPIAQDNCLPETLTFDDVATSGNCVDEPTVTRTWTATDSCGNAATAVQIFSFIDQTAPEITCPPDVTMTIDEYIQFPFLHKCDIVQSFAPTALSDNCDDDLTVTNNLNFEFDSISIYAFPIGTTPLIFTAEDNCGLTKTCFLNVTVDDIIGPTAIIAASNCRELGLDGTLTLNVDDIIGGFIDCDVTPLGLEISAFFTFVNGVAQPPNTEMITLTALDVGSVTVVIGYEDQFGNGGSATQVFDLVFPETGCNEPPMAQGSISTVVEEEVSDVQVYIGDQGDMVYTNEEGLFETNDPDVGMGYSFIPKYNERVREGLTTLDLVLISRHLVGLQPITDPHYLIAADVNYSGEINAFDLITLQKVLLWIEPEFPDGDAWRFVKKEYVWPLSNDPFSNPFPEMIMIDETSDYMHLDFTAIKVGDVNGSFVLSPGNSSDRSALAEATLGLQEKEFKTGETFSIPVFAKDLDLIQGLELELEADKILSILDIKAGQIRPTWSHRDGKTLIQWVNGAGQEMIVSEPLFEIEFSSSSEGLISKSLQLSSKYFENIAFANQKATHKFILEFQSLNDVGNIAPTPPRFYPNVPNPFRQETTLRFFLPESGMAELKIVDLDGRILLRENSFFEKGYQERVIRSDQLPGSGVMQVEIISRKGVISQKILMIRD